MVIGASVHPQPPYQDLQVVRFLHSVQFFGSILTSLHTFDFHNCILHYFKI